MASENIIMLITYNRLSLTKETFEKALTNTGCNYNLIVVDNGSTDDTPKWLSELDYKKYNIDKFIYALLPQNKGIGFGRSLALKIMKERIPETKYLSTLDNDIGLQDNWLVDCKKVIDYGVYNGKRIGMCGVSLEDKIYPAAELDLNGEKITVRIKDHGNLGTVCTVFKRQIFDMIGYYICYGNEHLYAHEDADYGWRIRLLGFTMAYLKDNGIDLCKKYNSDIGEYREFKDKQFKENLAEYHKNSKLYASGQKSLYVQFKQDLKELDIVEKY